MFNVTDDYKTAIKQPTRNVKGSIGIGNKELTNLSINGDFKYGTRYWSSGATPSILNNELILTGVGSASILSALNQIDGGIGQFVGHKIYTKITMKTLNDYATLFNLKTSLGMDEIETTIFSPVKDKTYYLSNILTVPSTNTSITIDINIRSEVASVEAGKVTKIKDVICIDLTDMYGIGNEPSITYMDELFSKVGQLSDVGNVPERFIDDRLYTNKITNGNFYNGTTGFGGSNCTISASNNKCTGIATATTTSHYFETQLTPIVGHKFYSRCYVDGIVNSRGLFQLNNRKSNGAYDTVSSSHITTNGVQSLIITPSSLFVSPYFSFRVQILDVNGNATYLGSNQAINISQCMVIDLTAIYGVGKEPTQAYMDTLMLTTGWFQSQLLPISITGEETIIQNFDIESSFGSSNIPTIGSTVSNKFKMSILNDSRIPQALVNVALRPYTSIDIGNGEYEWTRHGEYYAEYDDVVKNKMITTIDALDKLASYDNTVYETDLIFPSNIQQISDDLETSYGMKFSSKSLSGRNLCPSQIEEWNSGGYDVSGNVVPNSARIQCDKFNVNPNETYYFTTFDTNATYDIRFYITTFSIFGQKLRNMIVTNASTVVMNNDEYSVGMTIYETTDTVNYDFWKSAFANKEVRPFICLNSEPNKTFEVNIQTIQFHTKPVGTVRQVIGFIASYLGGNATMNDNGELEFRALKSSGFSMDASNYSSFKLTSDSIVNITELILKQPEKIPSVIAGNSTGFALEFENNEIVDEGLIDMYNLRFPISYHAYEMKSQGMPHLQIGDTISFSYVNNDNVVVNLTLPLLILSHKLTFNGGLSSELKADAPKKPTIDVTPTGGSNVTQAIERNYDNMQDAMTNAMLILTGNEGGNVITKLDETGRPYELIIADNPDLSQAHGVWVWNSGGLGFSADGYHSNDPSKYKIAITADGSIVAGAITTGSMSANRVRAGMLIDTTEKTWIDMDSGSFSFGGGKLVFNSVTGAFTINYNGSELSDQLDDLATKEELVPLNTYFKFGTSNLTIGRATSPQQITIDNTSIQFLDMASGSELPLLSGTGNQSAIKITYSTQQFIPYIVGDYIELANCVPLIYNGTWKVIECTTTYVIAISETPLTGTTRIEETNGVIVKTGTWTSENSASVSGGTHQYSQATASATMVFTGTGIKWITDKYSNRGIGKITLDGIVYNIDTYSATAVWQSIAFEKLDLPQGVHTIKLEWTNTKNASSTGFVIILDAFDIVGGTILTTFTTYGKVGYGFHANENAVAWINGQRMFIPKLEVAEIFKVGNHQLEKYGTTMTLIKYVG